ncbi:PhoH family protein [Athalassotoga saccharophila]|uniref:PhoH family protein n=1 Tax=Athalassotoga saccharophila TaxID=1441386 RepID=UPI001E4EA13C|nr:PhoH family protein [Athalassotoga saccharophila]
MDSELWIKGEEEKVKHVNGVLEKMVKIVLKEGSVDIRDLLNTKERTSSKIEGVGVFPKTKGQQKYIDAMKENDIVFSIGPAGTGKTYLAVAMAVEQLRSGQIQRIVLTRPAVEAGEKLGFLPGDMIEKVDPYLRPLYDALFDMMSPERFNYYREKGIIEVAPLAYMRGRTLNNAFMILDEAQNTTHGQLKMFLTRMGFGSKVVVTGDITQIDLENKSDSGLLEVQKILKEIKGVAFVYLEEEDVVRNPIVKRIIKAYESFEENSK